MSVDRALLAAYLRQRAELGERQVFLEGMDRLEAVALLGRRQASGVRLQGPPIDAAAAPGHPASDPIPARVREPGVAYASAAAALAALAEEIAACHQCAVAGACTRVVVGDGSPDAEVMVIGEAPGAEEDRTGVPFVGRAGKMLDLLLASIGFPRERVYICNVLKCRPPENRDPTPEEVAKCSPHLRRQIDIVRPRVILAVGRFSAQFLSGSDAPMSRLRGRVHSYEGVPVVATYHPAYLLRSPGEVRKCWEDLQLLRSVFDGGRVA